VLVRDLLDQCLPLRGQLAPLQLPLLLRLFEVATLPLKKLGGRLGAVWGSSATILFTLVGELAGPGGKPNDIKGRLARLSDLHAFLRQTFAREDRAVLVGLSPVVLSC
jgi:hypothetical protein